MNNIEISSESLREHCAKLLTHAGNSDWALYCDAEGNLDVRHNTESNGDWGEILSAYGLSDLEQCDGLADWLADNSSGWMRQSVDIDETQYNLIFKQITTALRRGI